MAECEKADIDVLITSTFRDAESQTALYAQGRTLPGNIVTNARAGQSWHNWRVAFDVVPMRNGKPVWGTSGKDGELWQSIGAIGQACGLEWAGDWKGKFIKWDGTSWEYEDIPVTPEPEHVKLSKTKQKSADLEKLIQAKIRKQAIDALKAEGKL